MGDQTQLSVVAQHLFIRSGHYCFSVAFVGRLNVVFCTHLYVELHVCRVAACLPFSRRRWCHVL